MTETQKSSPCLFTLLEIIAVYSNNEIKHVNAAHGQNVQFLSVKAAGTMDNVRTGSV